MSTVAHHAQDGNTPQKRCTGPCQRVLPATPEYFQRHRRYKDGLDYLCKECKRAESKAYYAAHQEEERARRAQYRAAHREEAAARTRRWRAAHREEALAATRRWYADHKEQVSEQKKQYHRDHREHISKRHGKWREGHAEELNAKQRKYYAEHVEEVLSYMKQYRQTECGIIAKRAGSHNRRARKKNAPGSHTAQQLREQYQRQRGRCYYCHKRLPTSRNSWNADHIVPLSRGGSNDISNIVIACPPCNRKKHDKLLHEWTDGGRLL